MSGCLPDPQAIVPLPALQIRCDPRPCVKLRGQAGGRGTACRLPLWAICPYRPCRACPLRYRTCRTKAAGPTGPRAVEEGPSWPGGLRHVRPAKGAGVGGARGPGEALGGDPQAPHDSPCRPLASPAGPAPLGAASGAKARSGGRMAPPATRADGAEGRGPHTGAPLPASGPDPGAAVRAGSGLRTPRWASSPPPPGQGSRAPGNFPGEREG